MTLLLSEADVRSVLTMPIALEAVEEISRRQQSGQAVLHARRRIELPHNGFFHYMAAADMAGGFLGMKLYTFVRGKLRFLVPLYRTETGELAALIEADFMGQMRTGAASGVATKYLARQDARTAGIVGTGWQARAQLEAVATVRKLQSARAYGRNPERRQKFCAEMSAKLGIPVTPAASAEEAVRGADIVATATTASHPVVSGVHLSPGAHVNAIGANFASKRELDDEVIRRARLIVVDSIEQSRQEAGDLMLPFGGDIARWSAVRELSEIVTGKTSGRTSDTDITLFKSNGIAVWDVAVAERVLAFAEQKALGRKLSLWET
ncbi:MAG TPA: ornithine cyclodeaminase family protein [Candidatus Acidoferrales bacterium]|nr:ornithine cyclodeaminase family protein [Candidatus Acidoferrales bacterium]